MTDTSANEGGAAVRAIARSANLIAEAREILPALDAVLRPAEAADVLSLLMEQCPGFGINRQDLGHEEWVARWAPYLETLDGLPFACVAEAFAMWHRGEMYPAQKGRHAFYPKPVELHTLAGQARTKVMMMRARIKGAMEHQDRRPPRVDRTKNREEAIAMGLLNPDGTVAPYRPPAEREELLAASRNARAGGQPINREHAGLAPRDDGEAI